MKEPEKAKFPIGHSKSQSKTFLPNVWNVNDKGYSLVDIAGIKDTDGDLFEIINQMINKKIYHLTKGVKFLTVFTKTQIENARGNEIREQINSLMRIF